MTLSMKSITWYFVTAILFAEVQDSLLFNVTDLLVVERLPSTFSMSKMRQIKH